MVVAWLNQAICCKQSPEVVCVFSSTGLGCIFVFGQGGALLVAFPCGGSILSTQHASGCPEHRISRWFPLGIPWRVL